MELKYYVDDYCDMDIQIHKVISRLNKQANRERNGTVKVEPDQEMLAITADTGIFFSVILKAIKARRILELGTSAGFSTLWFAGARVRTAIRR